MNDLINDLYQEIILDHGREPRNFGECDPHNKSADGHNPLCGDNLKLTFLLNDQNIICLLYTSPSPRDTDKSRMPSSA